MSAPRVVALGGGHGLAATLTALRTITSHVTAIVTVADNGGSSGRLRDEFGVLPPGDLRMALAALCSDDDWGRGWADILQYRFTSAGALNGHALGNLLLTALWDRDGDQVHGIKRVGELLRIQGRVLPMALDPLDIEGTFNTAYGRKIVRGQVEVATAKGRVEVLKLIPDSPRATPESLEAIAAAEWITFGPGSWFSSVMPHFLLREQAAAIAESRAKKIVILNLPEPESEDEFAGFSAQEHLALIFKHLPDLHIDIAIADHASLNYSPGLQGAVEGSGGQLIVGDLAKSPGSFHHDPQKLAPLLRHIFN
jgi:uncharacterized cofD-like protein